MNYQYDSKTQASVNFLNDIGITIEPEMGLNSYMFIKDEEIIEYDDQTPEVIGHIDIVSEFLEELTYEKENRDIE